MHFPFVHVLQEDGQSVLAKQMPLHCVTQVPFWHVAQFPAHPPFCGLHVTPHVQGWHCEFRHRPHVLMPQKVVGLHAAMHPAAHIPPMQRLQSGFWLHCALVAHVALQVPCDWHLPLVHMGQLSCGQSELVRHAPLHWPTHEPLMQVAQGPGQSLLETHLFPHDHGWQSPCTHCPQVGVQSELAVQFCWQPAEHCPSRQSLQAEVWSQSPFDWQVAPHA